MIDSLKVALKIKLTSHDKVLWYLMHGLHYFSVVVFIQEHVAMCGNNLCNSCIPQGT